jgi:hypothetical protein
MDKSMARCPSWAFFFVCLLSTGDLIQSLEHAKQTLCQWASPPPLVQLCFPLTIEFQLRPWQMSWGLAAGMAQAVEHQPSKYEALSSNPSTAKKKKIQARLGYIVNSKPAWTIKWNPDSRKENEDNINNRVLNRNSIENNSVNWGTNQTWAVHILEIFDL